MSSSQHNKLKKGHTCQLKHSDIQQIAATLKLSNANKKKLERAYKKSSGVRLQLDSDEINENFGAGFMDSAKKAASKGAQFVKNNKQLNNLKNQAIDKGLNYAVNKAGLGDELGDAVKGVSKGLINQGFNSVADGAGFMSVAKKGLKYGKQGLKIGNKISNALGYDDLDNMLIDGAVNYTVGRIDPTLGDITAKALNKVADKQLGGSFRKMGEGVNPYLPSTYGGSVAFHPTRANQPQKMTGQEISYDPDLRNQMLRHTNIRPDLQFI